MRDYDPSTGRYIQADPLGLVDGASVYGYALQNPGRYTDPRGLFSGLALDFEGTILDPDPYIDVYPGGGPGPDLEVHNPGGGMDIGLGGAIALMLALQLYDGLPGSEEDADTTEDCYDDCTPANAPFWNSLERYKGAVRRSGKGRKIRYYKWDYLHYCEVEVYDRLGRHLGAVWGDTPVTLRKPLFLVEQARNGNFSQSQSTIKGVRFGGNLQRPV